MARPPAVSRPSKQDSLVKASSRPSQENRFDPEYLRSQARWIRDDLDPQIAQEGPDALHSDELLTLDEFLRKMLDTDITLEIIRYSRMHLAILDVCERATRWPKKLIDRCDTIQHKWEATHGPLENLGTLLYEPGGRLYGICRPEDSSKKELLVKWLKSPDAKLSPAVARKAGDLGFTPGDWWISSLFAHRAGIIDSPNSEGGIVSDANGAYAVVMTGNDEVAGPDPSTFQYRAKDGDVGRYRLTAGTPRSRHPVRILRSHTLDSFWRPRAGLRYDGLHKVMGWSIKTNGTRGEAIFLLTFKRLVNQLPMDSVLRRPWSDEIEDYSQYKHLREEHKSKVKQRTL